MCHSNSSNYFDWTFSGQELNDFYNSEAGRDLFKILDNQALINPGLA